MIIGDVKFSCSPCIKGHRSANCSHVDRPLIEIKKKGRPPTQCSTCRELRKTSAIHGRCEHSRIDVKPALLTLSSSTATFPCTCGEALLCTCQASASASTSQPRPANPPSTTSVPKRKKKEANGRELSHGHNSSIKHSSHYDPYALPNSNNGASTSSRSNSISSVHSRDSNGNGWNGDGFEMRAGIKEERSKAERLFYLPENPEFTSFCYCGDQCSCPSCIVHSGRNAGSMKCGTSCSSFGLCVGSNENAQIQGVNSFQDILDSVIASEPIAIEPENSGGGPMEEWDRERGRNYLFQSQLLQLQRFPSNSDLTLSSYSISNHSNSSIDDSYHPQSFTYENGEGEVTFDSLIKEMESNQIDSVKEEITRWRSDLETPTLPVMSRNNSNPNNSNPSSYSSQLNLGTEARAYGVGVEEDFAIGEQSKFDTTFSIHPPKFYALPVANNGPITTNGGPLSYSPSIYASQMASQPTFAGGNNYFESGQNYRENEITSDAEGSHHSGTPSSAASETGLDYAYQNGSNAVEFNSLNLDSTSYPLQSPPELSPEEEEEYPPPLRTRNSSLNLERYLTERPSTSSFLELNRFETERPPDWNGVANGGEGNGESEKMSKSGSFFKKVRDKIRGDSK